MKKQFATLALAASVSVILSGCGSPVEVQQSQEQLAQYCGIDLDKLREDLKAEDPRIKDVKILDGDCKTRIEYTTDSGNTAYEDMDNDLMMSMLAAGALGAMAGYAMGGNSDRERYRSSYYQEDKRKRSAFVSPYVHQNSRAAGAYRTKSSASGINVSSKSGAVTTRSNPFKGTSSVARSSSYSGG